MRRLPWWFVVALLIGMAGIATGVALITHGLARRPLVARISPGGAEPSWPDPLPPAGPPQPTDIARWIPPASAGRPRSTPVRPAASHAAVPSPYRTLSPSTSSSPSPIPSPTGSPSPSTS